MPKIKQNKLMDLIKKLLKWAAGPLIIGIISFIIIQPLVKEIRGVDKYYIYLVSDFQDEETSKNIRARFKEKFKTGKKIDGVDIFIREEYDHFDPAKADKISAELAERDNTLLVVGHFYSNTTAAALPNYLGIEPKIPVILTTETNPNLLPPKTSESITPEKYCPVYCLSPDDSNQAKIAANHATRKAENQNFWVVQDVQNKIYSNFLAINFIETVQQRKDKKVLLLTDNNLTPSVETIRALDINCIFFAGGWRNALILVNQINAIYKNKPKPEIILSDWCVENKLIEQGQDGIEGIFLTFPLKEKDFRERGYGLYGEEAADIVEKIIYEADANLNKGRLKEWLGIHRVGDAREAIKKAMYAQFSGKNRKDGAFQVWQIQREDGVCQFRDWRE